MAPIAPPPTVATLGSTFDSRSNALNTVRLGLAGAVIFGHAALLGGYDLPRAVMLMLSEAPVDGFFVLSGFLLARSWLRQPRWGPYLWARFLRILPAFWVCLAVTALVLVPLVLLSQGDLTPQYWSAPDGPAGYLWRNATLWLSQPAIAGTPYGVAYPGTWNASLWTLFWEFLCYLLLGLLGVLGVLRKRWWMLGLAGLAWSVTAVKAAIPALADAYFDTFLGDVAPRLLLMFAIGVVFFLFADVVPSHPLFAGAAALVLLGSLNTQGDYRLIGAVPWAYLVLWLGCRLPLRVGARNDISYGVYIYAFPIQQAFALTGLATIGWFYSAVAAVICVLPLAGLSWVLVERRALRAKSSVPAILRRSRPGPGALILLIITVAFGAQMFGPGGY